MFLLGILAAGASLIRMLWQIWAANVGFDPTMDEECKPHLPILAKVSWLTIANKVLLTEEVYWCMMEVSIGMRSSLPNIYGSLY